MKEGDETIRVRAVELLHSTLGVVLTFIDDECDTFRAAGAVIHQVEFLDGALTFEKPLFWPLDEEHRCEGVGRTRSSSCPSS